MRNYVGIQALRGVAALSVAFGHILINRPFAGISPPVAAKLQLILQSGVDLFFVISGFIIAMSATDLAQRMGRHAASEFAIRRFARIYPLYWVVLLLAVATSYWVPPGPPWFSDKLGIEHFALATTQNFFVPVAWTLCFEVCFYLATALSIVIAPRHILSLSAAGAGVTALILFNAIALEFAFGIGIAVLVRLNFWQPGPLMCAIGATMLVSVGAWFCVHDAAISNEARTVTFGAGAALLLYAIVTIEIRGAKFSPILCYAGDISYSVYVWHVLILTWIRPVGPRAPEIYRAFVEFANLVPGLLPALLLFFIVAFSAASFMCVERPVLRLVRALRLNPSDDANDLVRNDGELHRRDRRSATT